MYECCGVPDDWAFLEFHTIFQHHPFSDSDTVTFKSIKSLLILLYSHSHHMAVIPIQKRARKSMDWALMSSLLRPCQDTGGCMLPCPSKGTVLSALLGQFCQPVWENTSLEEFWVSQFWGVTGVGEDWTPGLADPLRSWMLWLSAHKLLLE